MQDMAVKKMKRLKDPSLRQPMNITGANIRAARLRAGLTQRQLSERLETLAVYICRGSLSRIEGGERIVTDFELKALSEVLKTPVERLFFPEGMD